MDAEYGRCPMEFWEDSKNIRLVCKSLEYMGKEAREEPAKVWMRLGRRESRWRVEAARTTKGSLFSPKWMSFQKISEGEGGVISDLKISLHSFCFRNCNFMS